MSSIKENLRQVYENMLEALANAYQNLLPFYSIALNEAKNLSDKIPPDSGKSWWEYWLEASRGIAKDDYCALYKALKTLYDSLNLQARILKGLLNPNSNSYSEEKEKYDNVMALVHQLFRLLKLLEGLCQLKKSYKEFNDLKDSLLDE